ISVDALARELGVSQTPIRAALIRLESEGLVEKKHNSGYSAAPLPTGRRFDEIYELRLLLEPHAATQATKAITPDDLKNLQEAHAAMSAVGAEGARTSYGKFATMDAEFHGMIATIAGNSLVTETLRRLYTHMHLFRLQYHTAVTAEAILEHGEIVTAMSNGDSEEAGNAMRRHIENSRRRMAPFFE